MRSTQKQIALNYVKFHGRVSKWTVMRELEKFPYNIPQTNTERRLRDLAEGVNPEIQHPAFMNQIITDEYEPVQKGVGA